MSLDLRRISCDDVVARVADMLALQFIPVTEVRKRRSIGYRTDRGTWVRIEARAIDKIGGQGFNGHECAAVIREVSKPDWYQAVSWRDRALDIMWRADETELVDAKPVRPGGTLTSDPGLSDKWWRTLSCSLRTLSAFPTTRVATPTMQPITEWRVRDTVHQLFPGLEAGIDEWSTAHGDLFWTNLTAPTCWLLDWEDWGRAPRGYDAASLWHSSLALPALAERVSRELHSELSTRSGMLCQLMRCVETITAPPGYSDALLPAATKHAQRLAGQLAHPA